MTQIPKTTTSPYISMLAAAVLAKHAQTAQDRSDKVDPLVEHAEDNPQAKLVKVGWCEDIGCYIEQ